MRAVKVSITRNRIGHDTRVTPRLAILKYDSNLRSGSLDTQRSIWGSALTQETDVG